MAEQYRYSTHPDCSFRELYLPVVLRRIMRFQKVSEDAAKSMRVKGKGQTPKPQRKQLRPARGRRR